MLSSYSYIRVQTPEKQLISKKIDCAEPEYINMIPPNYQSSYGPATKRFGQLLALIGDALNSTALIGNCIHDAMIELLTKNYPLPFRATEVSVLTTFLLFVARQVQRTNFNYHRGQTSVFFFNRE